MLSEINAFVSLILNHDEISVMAGKYVTIKSAWFSKLDMRIPVYTKIASVCGLHCLEHVSMGCLAIELRPLTVQEICIKA